MRGDEFIGQQAGSVGDLICVLEDRRCGNTAHRDALAFQPRITSRVVANLRILAVGRAIDLDRKLCGRAIEIKDIGPERVLISEYRHAGPAMLQARPKHEFRLGQSSAESLRAL